MTDFLKHPWPWYVAGPLIGLMVPALLLIGNKHFGISANLRHICAACIPAKIPFFQYNWRKESWNLFFVAGIFVGAVIASNLLRDPDPLVIAPALSEEMDSYHLAQTGTLLPAGLFSWNSLLTLRGLVIMVIGGFLVGFGTRYAGGCTSGHAILGLSTLQWPSLVATIMFMAGGFITANLLLPVILKL
ncbi:YeeE/YedE family protein [Terrimonas sp. NA20]|uniref:YeeE/YedE family protein n=1 Tax=Terrimonas ginsenosidimutans TaxID=2908004 RepID=A0ABS9KVC0_9BACT|nr:YeeE/YedE thiosulfate transporter family protein [Terrimonas ginsenosidimutans]MCG2616302.1 YeeE/YedE family protein [Terrimonas ginsenosidimutans]